VRDGKAAHFAVRQVDAFEERGAAPATSRPTSSSRTAPTCSRCSTTEREQHRLTKSAPTRDPRLGAARHLGQGADGGDRALHESKIVHADLKPANAYLIEDATIGSGYQLKLIDMDFSLLADRRAPWHGFQGYVGTDNYRSPEHLTRGAVPGLASDVFTCG
jgi:serine/threonine protein kinase